MIIKNKKEESTMFRLINNINGTIETSNNKEELLKKALRYQSISNEVYFNNQLNLKAIQIVNDKTIVLTNQVV